MDVFFSFKLANLLVFLSFKNFCRWYFAEFRDLNIQKCCFDDSQIFFSERYSTPRNSFDVRKKLLATSTKESPKSRHANTRSPVYFRWRLEPFSPGNDDEAFCRRFKSANIHNSVLLSWVSLLLLKRHQLFCAERVSAFPQPETFRLFCGKIVTNETVVLVWNRRKMSFGLQKEAIN